MTTVLPVIVAAERRAWCGGVEGRTHKRSAGGLCEACNDYRPDWGWEKPTLATAFDDGRRYATSALVKFGRAYLERRADSAFSRAHLANFLDAVERGKHVKASG